MTSFRLCDTDKCDSVLFLDAILFFDTATVFKRYVGPLMIRDSDAGFGANIGSEHSRNSLQLGENVRVEEASV